LHAVDDHRVEFQFSVAAEQPKQVERVHCFDWRTGKTLWTYSYDCPYVGVSYQAGPRAAVTIDDGRAYALGTMGHLHCFDAASGEVLWARDLNAEYDIEMPTWGIAAAPLIEGDLLILQIGGKGACVVALDKKSGKERWRALDDPASYSAPILIEQAGRRVLVVWTGENVAGLDPQSGKVFWKQPHPPLQMMSNIATPVCDGRHLLVTSYFDGSLLLRVRQDKLAVEKLWHRVGPSPRDTDALHSVISTPILDGGHIYGLDSQGQFRCLEIGTGDRVWEDLSIVPQNRWATVHMVRHGAETWIFNDRGELVIGRLSPQGFDEIDRAKLIDPTRVQLNRRGGVCWSHPAFAYRHVFARSDKELVCADLSAPGEE
jgi:outer membrane protein assembly factor BamB